MRRSMTRCFGRFGARRHFRRRRKSFAISLPPESKWSFSSVNSSPEGGQVAGGADVFFQYLFPNLGAELESMMRALRTCALVCAIALALSSGRAAAQTGPITITIAGPGGQLSPIAVSGLKNLGGDDDHRIGSAFVGTLRRDLELSGYFRLLDPHAYIEDPQTSGFELGQFNFDDWRSINADFVVKGSVAGGGGGVKLTAYLYDVAQQRRMMGKSYTGDPADVPRMARRFADAILEAATGDRKS